MKDKASISIKIHQAYREIVAVCDSELLGKNFEDGETQLEVSEAFFKGEEMNEINAISLIREKATEDACFNFVGKRAVQAGIKAGIIDKDSVMKIKGIPYALALL